MAQSNHRPSAHDAEPMDDKHLNPLGRVHWMITESRGARARAEATLAMHCTGIHALARLLANSEAFRDVQANSQSVEPGHWPLNGHITDGLFTALLALSERAEQLSQSLPGVPGGGQSGKTGVNVDI
ncbi:hypothetical protein [Dyella humicola]|uniref:hypothetical protein n=1 Tax=Dyella humicola TaxID=2992126 RepID=UPI00224F3726|nr:hypothetical protein [Dyella humicola]